MHNEFPSLVLYSSQHESDVAINDWNSAANKLDALDINENHFAVFDMMEAGYVQCLGSKSELTVEARIYHSKTEFTHWVIAKSDLNHETTSVGPDEAQVTIDSSELLNINDALVVIKGFLHNRTIPEQYQKHDVTDKFM